MEETNNTRFTKTVILEEVKLAINRFGDGITEILSYLFFRSRFALAAKLFFPLLLMVVLFILPLIFVLRLSFWETRGMELVPTFSLRNYVYFLSEPVYRAAIGQSIKLGFLVSFICLLMGYPIALTLTHFRLKYRSVVTFILITPLFVSVVIRVFGWLILLESKGLINVTLQSLGIIDEPLKLVNSVTGVAIGIVNVLLVFMVVAIVAALAGIPKSVLEAARTLGANPIRVWWHVIWPLSGPGVLAGFVLVFASTISAFTQPRIIGGLRFLVVPILVYKEVLGVLNWPLGAAMGFVLLAVSLLASSLAYVVSQYIFFPHLRRQSARR